MRCMDFYMNFYFYRMFWNVWTISRKCESFHFVFYFNMIPYYKSLLFHIHIHTIIDFFFLSMYSRIKYDIFFMTSGFCYVLALLILECCILFPHECHIVPTTFFFSFCFSVLFRIEPNVIFLSFLFVFGLHHFSFIVHISNSNFAYYGCDIVTLMMYTRSFYRDFSIFHPYSGILHPLQSNRDNHIYFSIPYFLVSDLDFRKCDALMWFSFFLPFFLFSSVSHSLHIFQ